MNNLILTEDGKPKALSNSVIVPLFGKTEYGKQHVALLGGKGANLAEMHRLNIAVPPLVNLTTDAYMEWRMCEDPAVYVSALATDVLKQFETEAMVIGHEVLVSVRSGAPVSMPGMMDTILNVGLSLDTQEVWEDRFGPRWFWDSYSRLLIQLADARGLTGLPKHNAAQGLRSAQKATKILKAAKIDIDQMTSPLGALITAIEAVFQSWMTDRAIAYREIHNIDPDLGTACNIQRMVFGNLDDRSGTGVMFTRDPASGINLVTGEFLVQAQGEDVVDGSVTPLPLHEMKETTLGPDLPNELLDVAELLEDHYLDMQDVEFTIEKGKLWILQTRAAKRTSEAAFRIVCELVDDGIIEMGAAIERISVNDWYNARGTKLKDPPPADFTGLAAGSGIARGRAVFTSKAAEEAMDDVILVRPETTPDDIKGMYAAVGVLTFEGGMTSHAAVVARGMNTPCVVGASDVNGKISEGDTVVIDSATGDIWVNTELEISEQAGSEFADKVLYWAQSITRKMARRVRYVPYTLLPVAMMPNEAFNDMIESAILEGEWAEGVVLDMTVGLPFDAGSDGLSELAALSIPFNIAPMMKERAGRLKKVFAQGIICRTLENAMMVASPAELSVVENEIVKIDVAAWKKFLGATFGVVWDAVKDMPVTKNFIIDFVADEDTLIEEIFGE